MARIGEVVREIEVGPPPQKVQPGPAETPPARERPRREESPATPNPERDVPEREKQPA